MPRRLFACIAVHECLMVQHLPSCFQQHHKLVQLLILTHRVTCLYLVPFPFPHLYSSFYKSLFPFPHLYSSFYKSLLQTSWLFGSDREEIACWGLPEQQEWIRGSRGLFLSFVNTFMLKKPGYEIWESLGDIWGKNIMTLEGLQRNLCQFL